MTREHTTASSETDRFENIPLTGILPTRDGTIHVARTSAVLFAIWFGVAAFEVLLNFPTDGGGLETASTSVSYMYGVLSSISQVTMWVAVVSPVILWLVLDLPRGRRFIASLGASIAVIAPFSAADGLAYALRHADYIAGTPAEGETDAVFYVTETLSGVSEGVGMVVLFAFIVFLPLAIGLVVLTKLGYAEGMEAYGDE